jgi:hypothetical protein
MKKLELLAKLKKLLGRKKLTRSQKALAMLKRGGKKLKEFVLASQKRTQIPINLKKKLGEKTQLAINTKLFLGTELGKKLGFPLRSKLGD